ncbi:MAG: hypothetical protein PVG78_16965 [Desulfobacterales bacterium]|jgi:hypothetical protein
MAQTSLRRIFTAVLAAVLVVACAGPRTALKQTHVDEAFKESPVSHILVIGVTHREDNRRLFEDRFVAALKAAGVDAVASAEAIPIPPDMKLDKAAILSAVNRYGSDAVIITHMVDIEHKDAYSRRAGAGAGYYESYGILHSYYSDPGYSTSRTSVWLETNLYDVQSESLIWSAESKSWNVESDRQVVADVIQEVVRALLKSGVVAPK